MNLSTVPICCVLQLSSYEALPKHVSIYLRILEGWLRGQLVQAMYTYSCFYSASRVFFQCIDNSRGQTCLFCRLAAYPGGGSSCVYIHSIMTLQMLIKLTETLDAQSQYISHTDANIFNAASASQWRALLVHRVLCIHSPCLDWRSLIPSVRSWELRNCKVSRHLVYC